MQEQFAVMALQLTESTQVTVGDRTIWAVPGDVIVDAADGGRKLLHKIEFEQFVESGGFTVSGDLGYGWRSCKKA